MIKLSTPHHNNKSSGPRGTGSTKPPATPRKPHQEIPIFARGPDVKDAGRILEKRLVELSGIEPLTS